jgi:hypothetical protein
VLLLVCFLDRLSFPPPPHLFFKFSLVFFLILSHVLVSFFLRFAPFFDFRFSFLFVLLSFTLFLSSSLLILALYHFDFCHNY